MFPIISAKYKHLGIALLKLNRNQAVGPRGSLRGSSNRLPPDAAPRRRLCSQKMDKLCTGRTAARRPQIIPDSRGARSRRADAAGTCGEGQVRAARHSNPPRHLPVKPRGALASRPLLGYTQAHYSRVEFKLISGICRGRGGGGMGNRRPDRSFL